jgi:hypothetical protein
VSLKPGTGGLWNLLSVYAKKAAVVGQPAKPLAALGEELSEANESAEVRSRALVKATVTPADKKVLVGADGKITIPAAACGGAQVLGSFGGGHQLFSGGGAITCDVEVAQAGNYALTARVVTVQDNPSIKLSVGKAAPVDLAVPYTVGQWQQTAPVTVALAAGKNTLRFVRPDGSRGLSVREFVLTPVK